MHGTRIEIIISNGENVASRPATGPRKFVWRSHRANLRGRHRHPSKTSGGANSQTTGFPNKRSIYRRSKRSWNHFSARLHANGRKILSRDDGHWRRLARL